MENSSKDQSQKSKNSVCYWFVDTDLSTMFWLEDHLSTSKNLSWGKDIFTNRLWCDLSRLFSQTLKSLKSRIFLILSIWYIPWKHIWFWVLFVTKGQLRKRWWISWLYVRDKNVGSVGVWIYDWRVVDLAISYHTQLRKPLLISCRPLALALHLLQIEWMAVIAKHKQLILAIEWSESRVKIGTQFNSNNSARSSTNK